MLSVPALRHENRLVVIGSESRGHIVLDECALAAALFATADFQRFRRTHHERLIFPPIPYVEEMVGATDNGPTYLVSWLWFS